MSALSGYSHVLLREKKEKTYKKYGNYPMSCRGFDLL
jgi:hypothetical protein